MQLIVNETLNNFDNAVDDYYKLHIFDMLRTFTDILFDYVVQTAQDSEELLKEYNSLWKTMKTAEKKLEEKEKNNAGEN